MSRRARGLSVILAGIVAAVIGIGPLVAQNAGDLAKEMVGQWELSTAERSRTCVLTLANEKAATGLKIELDTGCAEALPFTRDIVAWTVKGLDLVRLINARGEPVIDLSEVESGILEGRRSGEGIYLLQALAAARATTRSLDQMFGEWSVVRANGQPTCVLALTSNPAPKDGFVVETRPRCEGPVGQLAPTSWQLERGELILISARGGMMRFELDDNAQWRRVPDTANPLLLVKR